MNSKLRPALKAAAIVIVINVILIFVIRFLAPAAQPLGNLLSCLLTIAAGLLAVKFYVAQSSVPATLGDGAKLGALAGAFLASVSLLLLVPLLFLGREQLYAQLAAQLEGQTVSSEMLTVSIIIATLIALLFLTLVSTLGGIIGVPLFEKRDKTNSNPPPTTTADNFNSSNFPPPAA